MVEEQNLQKEIMVLRERLYHLLDQEDATKVENVLKLSRELDHLLNEYQSETKNNEEPKT